MPRKGRVGTLLYHASLGGNHLGRVCACFQLLWGLMDKSRSYQLQCPFPRTKQWHFHRKYRVLAPFRYTLHPRMHLGQVCRAICFRFQYGVYVGLQVARINYALHFQQVARSLPLCVRRVCTHHPSAKTCSQ